MSDIVVGIDQSLRATGIATSTGALTTWKPGDKRVGVDRLDWYRSGFRDLFASLAPALVLLEGYAFAARNSHAHSLGELGGVIRLAARDAAVDLVIVPPTTLKKYVTGRGNAPKSSMQMHALKKWGVVIEDDNQCDAYALMRLGVESTTPANEQTKALADMLSKTERIAS